MGLVFSLDVELVFVGGGCVDRSHVDFHAEVGDVAVKRDGRDFVHCLLRLLGLLRALSGTTAAAAATAASRGAHDDGLFAVGHLDADETPLRLEGGEAGIVAVLHVCFSPFPGSSRRRRS